MIIDIHTHIWTRRLAASYGIPPIPQGGVTLPPRPAASILPRLALTMTIIVGGAGGTGLYHIDVLYIYIYIYIYICILYTYTIHICFGYCVVITRIYNPTSSTWQN